MKEHWIKFVHELIIANNGLKDDSDSAALNMPANLENSAVATGLEKVSFHPNPKEGQCQRMYKLPQNCTHPTHLAK